MQALDILVDEQIRVLESNARLTIAWFGSLLTVGLVASLVLYSLPATRSLDDVAKIGPSLVMAAISSFQLKTITVRRERLSFFRTLRHQLADLSTRGPEERETIVELVTAAIKDLGKRE